MITSPWTARRVTLLRRHWGKGKSGSEIGDMIGISRSAVIGKAHRLGLVGIPPATTRDGRAKKEPAPRPVRVVPEGPPRRARLVVPVTGAGIPLVDAGAFMCRFPIAGQGKDLAVCGAAVMETGDWRSPYCPPHHAKCHTRPEDRRRAPFVQAGTN